MNPTVHLLEANLQFIRNLLLNRSLVDEEGQRMTLPLEHWTRAVVALHRLSTQHMDIPSASPVELGL